MVLESQSFLWSWAYTTHEAGTFALLIAVVVIGLHRRLPGRIAYRAGGEWRLRPAVVSLVCLGLLTFHYLLDLNPMSRGCAGVLLLSHDHVICAGSARAPAPAVDRALGGRGRVLAPRRSGSIDRATLLVWLGLLLVTPLALGTDGRGHVALLRIVAVIR
jgi:hypothetical protein